MPRPSAAPTSCASDPPHVLQFKQQFTIDTITRECVNIPNRRRGLPVVAREIRHKRAAVAEKAVIERVRQLAAAKEAEQAAAGSGGDGAGGGSSGPPPLSKAVAATDRRDRYDRKSRKLLKEPSACRCFVVVAVVV